MRLKKIQAIYRGQDIALLALILFLVEFVRGATLVSLIPIYGKDVLGISLAIIGTAVSAHYFTDTVLKMVIGYLLDRFSAKLVINMGLLLSIAGIALFHFGKLPGVFIFAAALYGVGISPIWIVCLTKIKGEQQATQMAFFYMIWLIGMGSGPIVLNFILDLAPSGAYWLLLILSATPWVLSFFICGGKQTDSLSVSLRGQWVALRKNLKAMKQLFPGMILQTLGTSMLVPILPTFAAESLQFTQRSEYSLLLLLGGGCTALGLIPMGKWSDRSRHKPFLVVGFGTFAATLAALALYPSKLGAYGSAIILGLSYSAVLPTWNALLALYVPPEHKGLGWSLFSTIEGIGVLIGPVVGGILAKNFSASTVVWSSACLFGIITFLYLLFPVRWFMNNNRL